MIPQSKEIQQYLEGNIVGESELSYGSKHIAIRVAQKVVILKFDSNGEANIIRVIQDLTKQLK